ncbi:hypothetical protein PVAP13_9KG397134 [Panicum virgatum]|uniref:Uncharacterized protein n=1 Tax=Panicum virgatum TaxID=38727 RepID=A0A8T0N7M6_PANVG|nr:hypothetical protein PVAP13_9KG397134 [Panicum virgatum]
MAGGAPAADRGPNRGGAAASVRKWKKPSARLRTKGSERGGSRWQMKAASAETRRHQRWHVAAQWTRSATVAARAEKTRRRASSLSGSPSSSPPRHRCRLRSPA